MSDFYYTSVAGKNTAVGTYGPLTVTHIYWDDFIGCSQIGVGSYFTNIVSIQNNTEGTISDLILTLEYDVTPFGYTCSVAGGAASARGKQTLPIATTIAAGAFASVNYNISVGRSETSPSGTGVILNLSVAPQYTFVLGLTSDNSQYVETKCTGNPIINTPN